MFHDLHSGVHFMCNIEEVFFVLNNVKYSCKYVCKTSVSIKLEKKQRHYVYADNYVIILYFCIFDTARDPTII